MKGNRKVGVLGAGPGGIAAARYLSSEGFDPIIFEQSGQVGGQWHVGNTKSGIWPAMAANTSREMTHFSDLGFPDDVPVFPPASRIQQYLVDYIEQFGLQPALRLGHSVERLSRSADGGWNVSCKTTSGEKSVHHLSRVVIATGRFNNPRIPPVQGLDSSRCDGETQGDDGVGIRVLHSMHYKDPAAFRGLRVLVAGGAISALEIACDLVDSGAASVTCSSRRQRYVVGKLHHGIPTDHFNYSVSQAFAGELLSDDELASELKAFVLENAGNPEKSGAPRPHDDIRRAGWTKCQHYLDYVAKNQIATVPWIKRIGNTRVYFEDDSSRDVDAIIFATGFELGLPFLDTEIKQKLSLGPDRIALCKHTFHPELPGLALLGFYNQVGPYFPILELQARWIAYQFSGRCTAMDRKTMEDEIQKYCNDWSGERRIPMHQLALLFSREINAMPAVLDWPEISRPLLFGPLAPGVFRLAGPDTMKSAPEQVRNAGFACNMIMDNHFLAHEKERLRQLGLEKILNA